MTDANIQTMSTMLGQLIENLIIFYENITSGLNLLLFGFFFIALIYLIFHFFEEIIEWIGRITQ